MNIIAETKRLTLRAWTDSDRAVFRAMNGDEQVMTHFPGVMSSRQADDLFERELKRPQNTGFCAVEVTASGEIAGACGVYPASVSGVVPEGAYEIGWRFIPSQWGQGYAREAGEAWLDIAFEKLGLDEVYAWTAETNKPSLAVMRRCGMERTRDLDFVHPDVPDKYPQLKKHLVCRLTKAQWAAYK
ncbi:MAG: GNAT family N-acetyltransferase [Pseudomonadota bacterium]